MIHSDNIIYVKIKITILSIFLLFSGIQSLNALDLSVNNLSYGIKLKAPVLEVRYYQKEKSQNYGISLITESFWKFFPCELKAGNMICGGLWSFVKSPDLTYSNTPFFLGKTGLQSMTATLCSTNSFPDDCSYYFKAAYSNPKKLFSDFQSNCWYKPEQKMITGSALLKLKLSKQNYFGISAVIGKSSYEENIFSNWFTGSSAYFHKGEMLSGAGELSFFSKNLKILFITGLYTSPEGILKEVFRAENQIKISHFTFSFSGFYNPWNNLLLPGQKFLKQELDLRGGITFSDRIKLKIPFIIRAGINCYSRVVYSEDLFPLKISYGVQLSNPVFTSTLGITTGIEVPLQNQKVIFSSQKINFDSKIYYTKLILGFSGDWSVSSQNSGKSFVHKYGASIETGKKFKTSGNISWGQTLKSKKISANTITSNIGLKGQMGWINIDGKIGLKIEL